MRKRMEFLALIFFLGITTIFQSKIALADTMEYSVVANIPDNQINKKLSYFDLKMEPGAIQDISLTIKNTSKEIIRLMVEPNTAITNQNGVIDYSQAEHEKDSTLKYAFSDIISKKQLIVLDANESREVIFTIEMPEEELEGIILGGFYVYEIENSKSENSDAQIKNKYSYVIGVKLSENDKEVQPDLVLNEVESALINYRTAVVANLQNTEATIINNLEINAEITKEGNDEILHEAFQTDISMAPNSNFNFPINWDNQLLESGDYHLYLTATDGNQTWEFDKVFTIGEEALELNKEAVELEQNNILLYVGIGAFVIVGIGVFIILLSKNRGRDDKNDKE